MTLIPIQYYSLIYFNFILIICFFVFATSFNSDIASISNRRNKNNLGLLLLIISIIYMGFRPISFIFGDMVIYNAELESIMNGSDPKGNVEALFGLMMTFFASIKSPVLFFFSCSLLYIFPLYIASKRMFGDYWFYAFLMLLSAFTFWAYGVNGIRNGIAGSLFLLAISERKILFKYAIFVAMILIHKSLVIPLAAHIASKYIKNIKLYFLFWLFCIPTSLVLGSVLESFFLNLGFADDKATIYLTEFDQANELVTLKIGFRWDFIIYSTTAVFAAWYFIFKKNVNDVFYNHLVATYLLTNGFWILIIRANYSNRFAYLSWFFMGIVILYPLLKYQLFAKQNGVIGQIIFAYCFLGYVLNVILA